MTTLVVFFGFGLVLSGIALRIGIPFAHQLGVVDRPGGHKSHVHSTPFVGGVGVFVALLGTLAMTGYLSDASVLQWHAVAFAGSVMFITGLTDDIRNLGFKIRFLIQAGLALFMVLIGGVVLSDLGKLAFGHPLALGILAIPFTVFATIGVINAMNMIDGIDGLSGSVSLVSLFLLAMVALSGGAHDYATLALGLAGGVAGFLYFNMRYFRQRRARVFLGDNGSMLLGLLFAWMLIALSQAPIRAITPVTALWLFAIPLMDTLAVMLRRIWLGKPPFRPDRHHLHHLFLRAGFRVQDTVYAIAAIHLFLGVIGIVCMRTGAPEGLMFLNFLLAFGAYFLLILRPWRFVPALRRLHTLLGLTSPEIRGVFLGNCPPEDAQKMIYGLSYVMKSRDDVRLHVYQTQREGRQDHYVYAVLEVLGEDNDACVEETRQLVLMLRRRFKGKIALRVRQFVARKSENDPRVGDKGQVNDLRSVERRSKHKQILLHSEHGTSQSMAVMA